MLPKLTKDDIKAFETIRNAREKFYILQKTGDLSVHGKVHLTGRRLVCTCNHDVFIKHNLDSMMLLQCYLCHSVSVLSKESWVAYPEV